MPSEFKQTHTENLEIDSVDPWAVMAHFESLLNLRLSQEGEVPYNTTTEVEVEGAGNHSGESFDEVRPLLRPHELSAIKSMALTRMAWTFTQKWSVLVYLDMTSRSWDLTTSVRAPDETFVLGWREALRQETVTALREGAQALPPAPIPTPTPLQTWTAGQVSASTPDPTPGVSPTVNTTQAVTSPASGGFKAWMNDLSIEVVGGLLLLGVIAAGSLIWKFLF